MFDNLPVVWKLLVQPNYITLSSHTRFKKRMPANDSFSDSDRLLNELCVELLDQIRAGDEGALSIFYEKTLGKSYALAMQITASPVDAEDAVAETYIQVWRDAARYDEKRGRPLAWLLNICRSRAIDTLRRRGRAIVHPDPELLRSADEVAADDEAADPLLEMLNARDYAVLKEALAALPSLSRQLLGFAFFRDMTHQEIADATQLPLGTVKSHLRRALQKLRGSMESGRN